jgi:signal transduction histidine kinase/ActR/RegA family two-component response regulator
MRSGFEIKAAFFFVASPMTRPPTHPPFSDQPVLSTSDLEAQVAAATPDDMVRCVRIVLGMSGAFWERDFDSGTVWYSPTFFRVLGLPQDIHMREQINARIHPDDITTFQKTYDAALHQGGPFQYDVRFLDHAGQYRWARATGRVWLHPDGRPQRLMGMMSDVHAEKEAQLAAHDHRDNLAELVAERTASLDAALTEAQQQRAQAVEANRAKSEFLAHMSHELRTPLNGTLGMAELALRVAKEPAQRRYLDAALASGQTLLRLIDDVLDFARSDRQGLELQAEPFDLADDVAQVMRSLMPSVRPKGLLMMFDWQSEGDTTVIGDATRVRQVVTNLVGNACKYTAAGQVAVTAQITPTTPGRAQALVRVQDSGSGIDAARTQAVFEPFVQGDTGLTRGHGGAGLGLAIARRWARAMGGDVILATTGPDGSTFEFSWPVALPPHAPQPVAVRPGHAWLIYAVAGAVQQWLRTRFDRFGWRSDVLPSVSAAAEQARSHGERPQLVVVSERVLGSVDELTVLRDALPRALIALLVRPDWDRPEMEAAAVRLNMPLVVPPMTPNDLRRLLQAAHPQQADAPDAAGAVAHKERPTVLVVEDHPVNRLVAEAMLGELGVDVRCAGDGQQAVASCEASPPDLVLMDLQMPVMDGLEATRQLRQLQRSGRLPAFPIVALTAHVGEADRAQALAAGVDDYLTKPVQLPALEAALRRWLPPPPSDDLKRS